MLAKNRLTKKSYKSTVNMLASKLSKEGILFIEDITIKSPTTNVFIPIILNRELNEFVRENNEFVTLYPHSCLKTEIGVSKDVSSNGYSTYRIRVERMMLAR